MAPRFDEEEQRLELAVADLLDARLSRHLGFTNRGGYERMWLGQAIHSRYQEQALAGHAGYRREVVVRHTFERRGWTVTVEGRVDGLRPEGGRLVVEEIKSLRRGGRLAAAKRELYEQQARLYGWILARGGVPEAPLAAATSEEPEIAVELVLIEIGSEETVREPLELDLDRVETTVRERVDALLREHESARAAAAGRRLAAQRLTFPYPEPRPGQEEIVAAVERAVDERGHLLLEAPTGIGKTVAALLPALRRALAGEQKIYVLTAKTLQQEMATQVLELLNADRSFHSLRLRAKAKMCANDEVLCHEEYCRYARDYYAKLQSSRVVPKLLATRRTLLPDDLYAVAREAEVCPFEVSLELAGEAQVVVCDYNYAFDPYVGLSDFGRDGDLSEVTLIVDEIHNLVGRGRGYYSPALSSERAEAAARALDGGPHQGAAGLCRELADLIRAWVDDGLEEASGAPAAESPLPEDSLWALRAGFDEAFVDYLERQRESGGYRAEDPFVGLYFELLRFLDATLVAEGEAFSRSIVRTDPRRGERGAGGGDRQLRILCKDPSRFLGAVINRARTVVGLSATLSPPEFYRDLLGFDPERTTFLSLPSPFPEENRRVVIDDTVATTYRQRADNYPLIAERLAALAARVPGNCLALFPSYEFLRQVHRRLEVSGKRVVAQAPDDSDRRREETLDLLRSPLTGELLLLAVAGGVFAEGVDYPGEMLRAVAVVGPCLPSVSLEQELLKRYYQERFERGFEYAFVVPGMTRVVQAAGRLIRSADDVGIIALFDRRFLQSPYRKHLPGDWSPGGDPRALVGEPAAAARRFFEELDEGAATGAGAAIERPR